VRDELARKPLVQRLDRRVLSHDHVSGMADLVGQRLLHGGTGSGSGRLAVGLCAWALVWARRVSCCCAWLESSSLTTVAVAIAGGSCADGLAMPSGGFELHRRRHAASDPRADPRHSVPDRPVHRRAIGTGVRVSRRCCHLAISGSMAGSA
jgi:hypothetical protein